MPKKQPEEQIHCGLEGRLPRDEATNKDGSWGAACANGEGETDTSHPRALGTTGRAQEGARKMTASAHCLPDDRVEGVC